MPQWDMAKYGVSGLRLAGAMATWDLPTLLREINALSVWPPGFPLLEAPCFLAFGRGPEVASRLVLLLWASALLLLPWALSPLTERRSPALGWLVAATVAAGPMFQSFATLVMLEVPGLFLMVLALGFTLRALAGETWAWRATWLSCAALFFCKYNYGLLFVGPLLLFRARLEVPTSSGLSRAAASWVRRWAWPSPWVIFGLSAAFVLLALHLSGGFETELFGRHLSVTSAGNPALVLLWVLGLRAMWGRKRRRANWAALAEFDRRHQGLLRYMAAPILVWFLLPPHLKDFLGFVENRSSSLPFLARESLLFYPRAFLESLAPGPISGALILALAFAGLGYLRGWGGGSSEGKAFLALWALLSCTAVFVHPYKQDRFFFHAALALVVLAATVAFGALEKVCSSRPRRPLVAWLPWLPWLFGAVALAGSASLGFREVEVRRDVEARSVPASVNGLLDAVFEELAKGEGRPEKVLLLGTWNLASPWLFEWHAWQGTRSWQRPLLPLEPRDLVRGKNGEALAVRLGREKLRVLLIEPLEVRPDYEAEAAWLSPVRASLAETTRFVAEPERKLPSAGYQLLAWRPR